MANGAIDVLGNGAVLLGDDVVCDGHLEGRVRVQTHVHRDHMNDFSTSLQGEVLMTEATRELLTPKFRQLPHSGNVHDVVEGSVWRNDKVEVCVVCSQHMLGAVQVKVTDLVAKQTYGYSGDFTYPLDGTGAQPIQVNKLVVDATASDFKRGYSQEDAEEAYRDQLSRLLKEGPVHLCADTGLAEKGIQLLLEADDVELERTPIIVSEKMEQSLKVHREKGHICGQLELVLDGTEEAWGLLARKDPVLFVHGLRARIQNSDRLPVIRLSKYGTTDEPVEEHDDDVICVGLSLHADFTETVNYVLATGASEVIVDAHRGKQGNRAEKLRDALRREGLTADLSSNRPVRSGQVVPPQQQLGDRGM